MKYFLSILFILYLCDVFAQSQNEVLQMDINITNVRQKSFRNIMDKIEQKANITFSYNNSIINSDSIISILVFNGKLEDVLKKLMPPNISFILSSDNIILYRTPTKKQKIKKQKAFNNDIQKVASKKLVSRDEKAMIVAKKSAPVLKIKPYVFADINLRTPEKLENDTLAMISLAPVLVNKNNEELSQKSILNSKKKRKSFRSIVRQNNINSYEKRKITMKYSIGLFFQVLNESMQYNNFGTSENSTKIKDIITSAEVSSRSNRTGIIASVTFDHLRLTSGLALQRSRKDYDYKNMLDSTTTNLINVPDTSGFSLVGKNNYNYLSIPLFVGYEWNITHNLTFNGNVGIWAKILNSQKGYYIDLNTEPPHEFKDLENATMHKLQTDIAVDISLEYKLFKKTSIFFSASYMLPTGSAYNNEYPVTKSKSALGYSFAIIQKF